MPTAYLGLGSNLGDRTGNLRQARCGISAIAGVQRCRMSPIYETDPVGGPAGQARYLNAAAQIETTLAPEELMGQLLALEQRIGRAPRDQRVRWGPREMDIDLLFYDQQRIRRAELVIPHPRLHERWFVLRPLADLAPNLIHPVLGCTVEQLCLRLEPGASTEVRDIDGAPTKR